MLKASFWSDPDVLQWPIAKRLFFVGLISLAEDSACLEDSPFAWLRGLFSPRDADITEQLLATWRDEFIEADKLIPYTVGGKPYLYLRSFPRHQTLTNPRRPELPLPPWVKVFEHETDGRKIRLVHANPELRASEYWATVAQGLSKATSTPKGTESNTSESELKGAEANPVSGGDSNSPERVCAELESWLDSPFSPRQIKTIRETCADRGAEAVLADALDAVRAGKASPKSVLAAIRRATPAANTKETSTHGSRQAHDR